MSKNLSVVKVLILLSTFVLFSNCCFGGVKSKTFKSIKYSLWMDGLTSEDSAVKLAKELNLGQAQKNMSKPKFPEELIFILDTI